jgi:hypothetical protein
MGLVGLKVGGQWATEPEKQKKRSTGLYNLLLSGLLFATDNLLLLLCVGVKIPLKSMI